MLNVEYCSICLENIRCIIMIAENVMPMRVAATRGRGRCSCNGCRCGVIALSVVVFKEEGFLFRLAARIESKKRIFSLLDGSLCD
jgi:hypothetical protein